MAITHIELAQLIVWAYENCDDAAVRLSDGNEAAERAAIILIATCEDAETRGKLETFLKDSAKHMLTRELTTEAWKVLLLLFELAMQLKRPQPESFVVARSIEKIREALKDPIALTVWPYPPIEITYSSFAKVPLVQRPDLLQAHWPVKDFLLALVGWGIPRHGTRGA